MNAMKYALWHLGGSQPHRVRESSVALEKQLEAWIERDPALLQTGLTIVGRQLKVEGGYMDLLALDPNGRWVVIEIKRGELRRETVAQAVDYASSLAIMPEEELRAKTDAYLADGKQKIDGLLEERSGRDAIEEGNRDIQMFIVGTGREAGLERMISYLSEERDVPISAVTFDVFQLPDGQQILAREITEPDAQVVAKTERKKATMEEIRALAVANGLDEHFDLLRAFADRHDLPARPYKLSVMYTPPGNRKRMLFTAWFDRADGKVKFYLSPAALAEFYPVTEEDALSSVGESGFRMLDVPHLSQLLAKLESVLPPLHDREEGGY